MYSLLGWVRLNGRIPYGILIKEVVQAHYTCISETEKNIYKDGIFSLRDMFIEQNQIH